MFIEQAGVGVASGPQMQKGCIRRTQPWRSTFKREVLKDSSPTQTACQAGADDAQQNSAGDRHGSHGAIVVRAECIVKRRETPKATIGIHLTSGIRIVYITGDTERIVGRGEDEGR